MPDPKQPGPFDVRMIQELVRLMDERDLTAIDLRDGDQRVSLRRGPKVVPGLTPMAPALAMPAVVAASPTPAAPASPAADPVAPAKKLIEIKSPTPGTFYSSQNPESPPFVKVGSVVKPDTVVCIIEAMKVFNEIPAECSGKIVEILVENQQSVEWGQVLFRVDPTG